jgi:hypothetical protein
MTARPQIFRESYQEKAVRKFKENPVVPMGLFIPLNTYTTSFLCPGRSARDNGGPSRRYGQNETRAGAILQ